ncbi:hypothetical protein HYS31_00785 [Candidatus Woesearchaeota archaeon]|nr:hypothetical protein [Candidatus Woesearchaeota archaeon]
MENRDKILQFIRVKGPVLPVEISKIIGTDILISSAHLAELTASGKLKISAIKVGGSPLYYLSGQEAMLQKFIGGMNDKERKAYDLLQQSKVLRDSEQEPVIRVAMREIRDFAVQLNVTHENKTEIFWKWHLLSNEEAELLIKSKLNLPAKKAEQPLPNAVEEKPIEKTAEEEHAKTVQRELPAEQEPAKRERKPKQKETEDSFLREISRFFEKNKINIVNSEVIKKNSEIDFVVEIPSVVGNLQYYCKAKSKKRVSDSDLSNAYVKGQFKKLPVIFLSPGELSAKAQEMISKELRNLTFKKI